MRGASQIGQKERPSASMIHTFSVRFLEIGHSGQGSNRRLPGIRRSRCGLPTRASGKTPETGELA
jgi:hypothetical protein